MGEAVAWTKRGGFQAVFEGCSDLLRAPNRFDFSEDGPRFARPRVDRHRPTHPSLAFADHIRRCRPGDDPRIVQERHSNWPVEAVWLLVDHLLQCNDRTFEISRATEVPVKIQIEQPPLE